MGDVLVIYDSGYGATEQAAKIIAESLTEMGLPVDLELADRQDLAQYEAVLVGSPIRVGRCTTKIKRLLKENLIPLRSTRAAFFFTCMSLTSSEWMPELPVYIDPSFADPQKPAARIGMMKRNHMVSYYLQHFLKNIPGVKPLGLAFFKGRLHTKELRLVHGLIMRLAMFSLPEIRDGDYLNPIAIRAWAKNIHTGMRPTGDRV